MIFSVTVIPIFDNLPRIDFDCSLLQTRQTTASSITALNMPNIPVGQPSVTEAETKGATLDGNNLVSHDQAWSVTYNGV
jgi:hypothetical protein